ncbi:MAG: HlyD family secretion protein [Roseibium sp.]|uniref:HlyD family secretion protein n=1 Tax=Roseibium sp. TaxID=1936156 RepID=UPI002611B68B|nr:HlyD family secretion protein [Roseibium sp.]MCV0429461.1 HlyD family secretion protein [Roseibium sp.]
MFRILKRLTKWTFAFLILTAVGLLALFFGRDYWTNGRFLEVTDNAYVRSDIVAIAPKVPGYIIEVSVRDNQPVQAGDILFRIDREDHEARLAQSSASLRAARAAKVSLAKERKLQQALIEEAKAGLAAAKAEATRTRRDRKRADNLVNKGWATEQRHDTAVALQVRAQAAVDQAQARLAAREQRLAVIDTETVRLEASIEQAFAQLKLAEIALNNTVVRAPLSGIVGNRHVEVGHYAQPGAPLLSLVATDHIWVVANFKETQLSRIEPGQKVKIQVDTFGDREISGLVDSLAPASGAEFSLLPPDNATGNFVRVVQRIPVKILLDKESTAPDTLRPGMSARVAVRTGGTPEAPLASLFEIARTLVAEIRDAPQELAR